MNANRESPVLDWLLEENNPSVRYFSLIDLLDTPSGDLRVVNARREIMKSPVVSRILGKQHGDGYWETARNFYTPKYKSTVWQLMILAELGADGKDERIRKACEYILENSQERGSGGFAIDAGTTGGGLPGRVIPCLTGNVVWSLIRFGYLDDARVRHGIDWITTYQRFDDGVKARPKGWPYDQFPSCWGTHTCHMGVVKSLKALAEIPVKRRSQAVRSTIEQSAEFMLMHHVHKRSHDLGRVSKPGWKRFGFPLMYQTDVLEILGILTGLGYRDDRMQEAVDLVVSKRDPQGRWKLENTFNGRFQTNIEQKGKASKWITLSGLRVLKRVDPKDQNPTR